MEILIHFTDDGPGYDLCWILNTPTGRGLLQRATVLLLLFLSVGLFCFNVMLVWPYMYPSDRNLSQSSYFGLRQGGAPEEQDETRIRAIMQNLDNQGLDAMQDKARRFQEKVQEEQPSDETEPMLDYAQRKYYPLHLNPHQLCRSAIDNSPEPIYLLLVIKSVTSGFERRKAIRQTWGDTHKLHLHLEQTGFSSRGIPINGKQQSRPLIVKRLFLLAKQDQADRKNRAHQDLLEHEFLEYRDILQGDFQDSFRNLTLKDVMFLSWHRIYCPQVQFIFKGDDDVFVNVYNVLRYVESQNTTVQRQMFTGSVLYPSPRITNPKSKYYVSSNLWSEKYYPPYVSGGGFIMSSFVAAQIFEVMKILPIIPIDDAFVGICLQKLGIFPINHKGFKSWGVSRGDRDVCVFQDIMTLHKLMPDEMIQKWKLLIDSFHKPPQQCSQRFKFNMDQ